jgi:hypothetical protein
MFENAPMDLDPESRALGLQPIINNQPKNKSKKKQINPKTRTYQGKYI